MSTKPISPDFAAIKDQIEQAHVERAAYLGSLIAEGGVALARAVKRLGATMERGYNAELDRRAVEADAFLRRSTQ